MMGFIARLRRWLGGVRWYYSSGRAVLEVGGRVVAVEPDLPRGTIMAVCEGKRRSFDHTQEDLSARQRALSIPCLRKVLDHADALVEHVVSVIDDAACAEKAAAVFRSKSGKGWAYTGLSSIGAKEAPYIGLYVLDHDEVTPVLDELKRLGYHRSGDPRVTHCLEWAYFRDTDDMHTGDIRVCVDFVSGGACEVRPIGGAEREPLGYEIVCTGESAGSEPEGQEVPYEQ